MARNNYPPTDPRLPSSQDWPEQRDPNRVGKKRELGDTYAQTGPRTTRAKPSHRNASTLVRGIAPIFSWLFGVTAEAARAATVQVLKYVMITALLAIVTGGSFIAFLEYDLFELLGRIASNGQVASKKPDVIPEKPDVIPKKPDVMKKPDAIEKELLNRQTVPSTPADIETSGPKDTAPFPSPAPLKPSKPPLPASDWKTEVFRTPYY